MPRVPMESFPEGEEIVRVYLASAVSEAEQVEEALDATDVDFAIEVEAFRGGVLLGGSTRAAAGFWIPVAEVDRCADALEAAGLLRGLVDRSAR